MARLLLIWLQRSFHLPLRCWSPIVRVLIWCSANIVSCSTHRLWQNQLSSGMYLGLQTYAVYIYLYIYYQLGMYVSSLAVSGVGGQFCPVGVHRSYGPWNLCKNNQKISFKAKHIAPLFYQIHIYYELRKLNFKDVYKLNTCFTLKWVSIKSTLVWLFCWNDLQDIG